MAGAIQPCGDQGGADDCDGQSAEAGGDLQSGGLAGEVVQQLQPQALALAGDGHEAVAAGGGGVEGDQFGEALDGFGGVGAEFAERAAGGGGQPVDAGAAEDRRGGGVGEERQQGECQRPGDPGQRAEHGGGDQHGDQRRGDGVGEEILDGLDVLGGQRDEIAGSAPEEIGGGECVEPGEELDAQLGQQLVGHVVRQPGLQPVQQGGGGGGGEQADHQGLGRAGGLDRADCQGAQHADADEGKHAADPA